MTSDLKSELKDFLQSRIEDLPPSERPPFEAILEQLRTRQATQGRLYFLTANLSKPNEARRLEAVLAREGVIAVEQQANHWTDKGDLVVYVGLRVTPVLYAELESESRRPWWTRWFA